MKGSIKLCLLIFLGIIAISEIKGKSSKLARTHFIRNRFNFASNFAARNGSTDPEVNKRVAQMARYIVHNSNWVSVATISIEDDVLDFPFNNIKSMVDGPTRNSTGYPYFYLTPKDFTAKDLEKDDRATITFSMDQDGYCSKRHLDPEDPKCGRVVIVGCIKKLDPDSEDYKFGYDAFIERHPSAKHWPENYDFFIAKMKVLDVVLYYGSFEALCAPIDVYFQVKPKFIELKKIY